MGSGVQWQVLPMKGGIVVLDSDKTQIKEHKYKRKEVEEEALAYQLSSRSFVTNAPRQ